jgi:tRNA(fMet)-specific endonuclease VapC
MRIDALVEELEALDFDLPAATAYGRLRVRLEQGGTPIGPNDMLIAAQAGARNLTLVTDNTAEFSRVKGLKVANWRR